MTSLVGLASFSLLRILIEHGSYRLRCSIKHCHFILMIMTILFFFRFQKWGDEDFKGSFEPSDAELTILK